MGNYIIEVFDKKTGELIAKSEEVQKVADYLGISSEYIYQIAKGRAKSNYIKTTKRKYEDLYIYHTADDYQLPIHVATPHEMADYMNTTIQILRHITWWNRHHDRTLTRDYLNRVRVYEDDFIEEFDSYFKEI